MREIELIHEAIPWQRDEITRRLSPDSHRPWQYTVKGTNKVSYYWTP